MTRILAIDFGTRRIGAAICDPGRTIAFPLEVYNRIGPERDARHYCELVAENDVERIVVGLPLHNSGREGQSASQARRELGKWLSAVTGRPVVYFDERYSTVEAEHRLIDAGLTRQKRKALRDKLAARFCSKRTLTLAAPKWKPLLLRWRTRARSTRDDPHHRLRLSGPAARGLAPPEMAESRVLGTVRWGSRAGRDRQARYRASEHCRSVLGPDALSALPCPLTRVFYCVGFDRAAGATQCGPCTVRWYST